MDKNKLILDCVEKFKLAKRAPFTCNQEQIDAMVDCIINNIPALLETALKSQNRDLRISSYCVNMPSTTVTDLNIVPDNLKLLFFASLPSLQKKLSELGIDSDIDSDAVYIRVGEIKKFCKFETIQPMC